MIPDSTPKKRRTLRVSDMEVAAPGGLAGRRHQQSFEPLSFLLCRAAGIPPLQQVGGGAGSLDSATAMPLSLKVPGIRAVPRRQLGTFRLSCMGAII